MSRVAVAIAGLDSPDGWLGSAPGDQVLEAQFPTRTETSASPGRWYPDPPFGELVSEASGTVEGTIIVRWQAGYKSPARSRPRSKLPSC